MTDDEFAELLKCVRALSADELLALTHVLETIIAEGDGESPAGNFHRGCT